MVQNCTRKVGPVGNTASQKAESLVARMEAEQIKYRRCPQQPGFSLWEKGFTNKCRKGQTAVNILERLELESL